VPIIKDWQRQNVKTLYSLLPAPVGHLAIRSVRTAILLKTVSRAIIQAPVSGVNGVNDVNEVNDLNDISAQSGDFA
jgi:hypothetical protein